MEALEFFCGLGGFAAAAADLGWPVAKAFDQDADACAVYEANFGRAPVRLTLDSLDLETLPAAEFWWMSPPCTPFTRRGLRRDACDPRSAAFLRMIEEVARRGQRGEGPRAVVVENVLGFSGSEVHCRLARAWQGAGYTLVETGLCPTRFGIPMKRPRVFLVAVAQGLPVPRLAGSRERGAGGGAWRRPLSAYLDPQAEGSPVLRVTAEERDRYGESLNVVDPADPGACAICFTSGYGKSWKAAGSYLRCSDGGLRRFAPEEILRLLGFPAGFQFPEGISLPRRWHLAGNSLSLDCVKPVLGALEG